MGFFVVFLCVELLMSILSYFAIERMPKYEHVLRENKKAFRILCLGDSFTYGIGADARFSYPAQMQEILNKREQDNKVEVFNLGVPGYNSAQVLKKLKEESPNLKPDAVVIMCGANDTWNFDDIKIRLDGELFRSLCARLRIYKLFSVFLQNIKLRIAHINSESQNNRFAEMCLREEQDSFKLISYANIFRDFGYYEWAKRFYLKAGLNNKNDSLVALELGRCCKLNREYSKAVNILEYALNMHPDNQSLHYELRDVFVRMNIIEQTILFYEEFLRKFPDNAFARKFLSQAYIHIAGDFYRDNYLEKSRTHYLKALELSPENKEDLKDSIAMIDSNLKRKTGYLQSKLQDKNGFLRTAGLYIADIVMGERVVSSVLADNFTEMIDFCKKNNIRLFFSGYPEGVSAAMEKAALMHDIELIRHQGIFFRLLKNKPETDFFVSEQDRHCTKYGYGVVAKNIAGRIISLLDKN